MCLKLNDSGADTNNDAFSFQGSFVEYPDTKTLKDSEWEEMARNWLEIEDDPEISNHKIKEAMEDMEDDPKESLEDNKDDEVQDGMNKFLWVTPAYMNLRIRLQTTLIWRHNTSTANEFRWCGRANCQKPVFLDDCTTIQCRIVQ